MSDDYVALIRPIEKRLIRTIWRIVGDENEAEDVLQETVLRVWSRLDQVRRHPNPHALILRSAMNVAYDSLRARSRRRTSSETDDLPDRGGSPCDCLETDEIRGQVLLALGRLSRPQAEALLLRFADESSYEEIASVLGCKTSTARTHVERGRRRLRAILGHLRARY